MLVVDSSKNDVALIRIDIVNHCEKSCPWHYSIFSGILLYIHQLQAIQGIKLYKKNTSTILSKMKSRLYKIDCRLAEEDILHHNQAPHPGYIWHKRSGSIASCMSC